MAAPAAETLELVSAEVVSSLLTFCCSVLGINLFFFVHMIGVLIDFVGTIDWECIREAVLSHTASVTRVCSQVLSGYQCCWSP